MQNKPSVLVISGLFPDPSRPIYGIFVKNQVDYQRFLCKQVVVVPVRIFPPAVIWAKIIHPLEFLHSLQQWYLSVKRIPSLGRLDDIPTYYPWYSSLPRQLIGTWGWFAYPFLVRLLRLLHQKHQFDIIHAHFALPEGVIALLLQKKMNIPFVVSIHGADLTYAVRQNSLNRYILRMVFSHAQAVLVNSMKTAQEVGYYCDSPEKIFVVRLGANPPIEAEKFIKKERSSLYILSVAHLEERKGHKYLLNAMQILLQDGYDVSCIIVGSGPEEQSLRSLSIELGISDHVIFEGSKSHDDVWPFFSNCDIFVLPSWDEAFGLVYIEALSMGKPVVGCEGEGGPEDLRKLGDCIEMIKPRDVTTLVQALKKLIDNPERRQKMGQVGVEIVRKYYSWEQTAASTLEIYQQIINNYRTRI